MSDRRPDDYDRTPSKLVSDPRVDPAAPMPDEPARQPIFNLPIVISVLIALFMGIHAIREYVLTVPQDNNLLRALAFVPARLSILFNPQAVSDSLVDLAGRSREFQIARFFLGDGSPQVWSILTYSFLHGDFVHAGVNSLWLAVFGAPVARRIGAIRFLALFAITAIAGAGLHFALHPVAVIPVVGASAAVSGAMAAALRFVFQPGGPLGPAVPGWRLPPEYSARLPALPLRDVIRDRRVMRFVGIWFVINLLFGLFSVQLGATSSPIAWEAHVGGFIAGFFLFRFFDPPGPEPEFFAQFREPVWRR